MIGIWGVGGIGKTTLAEAIFKQVSNNFDGKCFMANVRENSERGGGLEQLQKEVISCLLGETLVFGGSNIPQYTKDRLQRMKVFLILDDVNKLGQLDYLTRGLHQFGPGSRVIITTRDKQVLYQYCVEHIYQVKGLNNHEALELFCNVAFKQNHQPIEDLIVLSKKLVKHAKDNPLALKVLGSFLRPKTKQDWENALDNFKLISEPNIYDVLKISYDELNWAMKNIFLDIACFFKGYEKEYMKLIFDDIYSMHYALDVLVDKSLITISNDGILEMHDLLQEMGREIVRQESEDEPEKRSRLWNHKDICHVLNKNKGTNLVKGIFLDLSKIKDINLDCRAFAKMTSLRMLKFYAIGYLDVSDYLYENLEYLSEELRYLHWYGYPYNSLPKDFNPENLIRLCLPFSKVEQLWEGRKEAYKLKYIDLHHSRYLVNIPHTPNLEVLNLWNCEKLSCVPSYIQNFNTLGLLCLKSCHNLSSFPHNIHFRSPITINLSDCVNLTKFPEISGEIRKLHLKGTAIVEVPSSVQSLTHLEILDLRCCRRLKVLPTSICKLKSLSSLKLNKCSKFESFPQILEKMERLSYIGLRSTAIKELPSSIDNVEGLKSLMLAGCSEFHSLPENLRNLNSLSEIYLGKTAITQIPQDIGCLSSLEYLSLSGNNFESLPTDIKRLSKLRELILINCNMLQSLPELPASLVDLKATNCKRLQSLPELPSRLDELDASILDKLFEQRDKGFYSSGLLDFKNCMKLNENTNNNVLADLQLRIQHMATTQLGKLNEHEVDTDIRGSVNIFLPGSRIPEWFNNQSLGSSITIQLPQLCRNRSFIGFALCVVLEFGDVYAAAEDFIVVCEYSFEANGCSWMMMASECDEIYDPDHICIGFIPCLPDLQHHTSFSFDFLPNEGVEVKCCGVCPVYAHPTETKPNTFTVNMVPPAIEECRKLHNEFRDEASTSSTTVGGSDEEEINTPRQQSSFLSQIFRCFGIDFNCL